MRSRLTSTFMECFAQLPERVRYTAKKNYRLWKADPGHPSLEFKKTHTREELYSVRVGLGWRALGYKEEDRIAWFWIGSHAEYNRLIKTL